MTLAPEGERLSTVDLLALTNLDQLIFIIYKISSFVEEVNCTEPFPSVIVPCLNFQGQLAEQSSSDPRV